ncbi:MAG: uridine kinase [Oscillospiraceae bacterium]|nr:uridine kinase [Oscillospiraceae bacterium]
MEIGQTMIIGIAGGTGSGKTTLTLRLKEEFGADVSVLNHDSYYKSHDDLPYEARCKLNYDHPDAFDTERMIRDLESLRRGEPILCPVYDYSIHNRSQETVEVLPTRVIVVEGILIFQNQQLRSLMDIKLFVDTDADVRILRRILRDVKERGRSLDSVVEQYLTTVKPMHEAFVEPSKRYADLIVPEGGYNVVALDMLIQRVRSHVAQTTR